MASEYLLVFAVGAAVAVAAVLLLLTAAVCRRARAAGAATEALAERAGYRVWFAPTWDTAMGIEVKCESGAAGLTVTESRLVEMADAHGGAAEALRFAAERARREGGRPEDYLIASVEEIRVTGERLRELVAALAELGPWDIPGGASVGMDGMTVSGVVEGYGRGPHEFSAWSPSRDGEPRLYRYATLLFNFALECSSNQRTARLLEGVHQYFEPGLPAMDLGGSPRRIHLFGTLRAEHEEDLRRFLGSVADEDVEVDMRNFQGMDPVLYPVFLEADRRWPRARWVANRYASEHLAKMGIEHEQGGIP